MPNFYVLESGDGLLFGDKWSYAEMLPPINLGESEKCPICGAAVSDQKWLPPTGLNYHQMKKRNGGICYGESVFG
jgi:hypothetical protein